MVNVVLGYTAHLLVLHNLASVLVNAIVSLLPLLAIPLSTVTQFH